VNLSASIRIIWILETNCHSRERVPGEDEWDDEDTVQMEPDEAGVWFIASFMGQSYPQANQISFPCSFFFFFFRGNYLGADHSCLSVPITHSLFPDHSCLPNCNAYLPPSTPPALELRATRPIKKGEILTISYTDEEYQSTSSRQKRLYRRGFQCSCPLCKGPDVFRPAVCPTCAAAGRAGVLIPPYWRCLHCAQVYQKVGDQVDRHDQLLGMEPEKLSDASRSVLYKAVDWLIPLVVEYIDSPETRPRFKSDPASLIEHLQGISIASSLNASPAGAEAAPPSSALNGQAAPASPGLFPLNPLHVAHFALYAHLSHTVFSNPLFKSTSGPRSVMAAFSYLVACYSWAYDYFATMTDALAACPFLPIPLVRKPGGAPCSEGIRHAFEHLAKSSETENDEDMLSWARERAMAIARVLEGENGEHAQPSHYEKEEGFEEEDEDD
jgi:hypothetical protein